MKEENEEEEEDEDIDLDATLDLDKLTKEQLDELDVIALNFGMKKKDFLTFLEVDQDEAETKRSLARNRLRVTSPAVSAQCARAYRASATVRQTMLRNNITD
jgi:hypothetical protein